MSSRSKDKAVNDARLEKGTLIASGFIAVAAHSDGYNLFSSLHSLNAFTEELLQVCLVLLIVPWSPSFSVPLAYSLSQA